MIARRMVESLQGVLVLVVDDHVDTLELLAMLLREAGAEVRIASDAIDAIAALEGWAPHVVILDVGLPVEDGYALLRRIRARPETISVPAIAFTGLAFEEDRGRAREAGFNLQVTKPVDFEDIVKAVAGLVARPLGDSPTSVVRVPAPADTKHTA